MNQDQTKLEIAKAVCLRFINMRETTSRHQILVKSENPNLLYEMERRNLLQASDDRSAYRPTVGTFALLGDDDELYQRAREGFTRTAFALYNLYCVEGCSVDHEPFEFARYVSKLYDDPTPHDLITLGLYLAVEFGLLQPLKMSDNRFTVERFRVTELAIKMREPAPTWMQQVQAFREAAPAFNVPVDQLLATAYDFADGEEPPAESFDKDGFWSLIHPAVAGEAHSRFEAEHFADAVEAALKVVAEMVRRRTGLNLDGADLMHRAFGPKGPYLKFEDPIPKTQDSMQQGYMEMFAGAMMGVRNPKVHGLVKLERERCVHFLFLASLLAHKVDDAVVAGPTEPVHKSESAPKFELASLKISAERKGLSGEVRTVNVSAVIENISPTKRINEYSCTLSVPSSCLTFQSAMYWGEIKSEVAGRRSFRRTEIDDGATKVILPGDKLKVYNLDLGIDQLKMKGTRLEGDFEGVLKEKVTLDAVIQGQQLHAEKAISDLFEGMI